MQHVVRTVILVLCILVAAPVPTNAADWWGHRLADTPTDFIVGYGSLINRGSRNATAASPVDAIPVRVSAAFGYIRTWNARAASGFTALGLRKQAPGEPGRSINGVLYPVEGGDIAKFDAREAGYRRVEIPQAQIEAVGWQRAPVDGHIWLYVPVDDTPAPPDAHFPLLQSYIDVVIEGGLQFGEAFALEILDTTDGWSPVWLNDRILPRRPWVNDTTTGAVDDLLARAPATDKLLSSRMMPENFAARWLAEPVTQAGH